MAKRVKRAPNLPNITANVRDSVQQLNRALYNDTVEQNYRLNLAFPKDGTEPFEAPLPLQQVATASLPDPTLFEGTIIYDTTTNKFLYSNGTSWITVPSPATATRRTITTTDTVVAADQGNIIEATSGTFTLSFTGASTLGSGFWTIIYNSGTGDVTLDPASSEQIDGLTTWVLYPGGSILVVCTGSAFESILLSPMRKQFDSSSTFTKPGVGSRYQADAWGAGGSGGRAGSTDGGGGGGGGAHYYRYGALSELGTTETVTIGAGAAARTVDNQDGQAGGDTTFGSLLSAFGGGGGGGNVADAGGGGGGGGSISAGASVAASIVGGDGGDPNFAYLDISDSGIVVTGLGDGFDGSDSGGGGGANGNAAGAGETGGNAEHGGGGGGGGGTTDGGPGGASIWGGAGGGGGGGTTASANVGGISNYGGSGGRGQTGNTAATAGSAPGGGGGGSETGNSGAGAAGRVVVVVW